jgi:type IV pilus assembly protein PilA
MAHTLQRGFAKGSSMARRTANPHRTVRAFTLIELMIVVAIVSVLAVLAVVGYRKLIVSAHTSEATHMVQSIRTAEESYHAEAQTYVSTSADGVSGLYPLTNDPPGAWKSLWTTPSGVCTPAVSGGLITGTTTCWNLIPVHADGPVMYGYATVAGTAGVQPLTIKPALTSITLTSYSGNSPTDWYWITAKGNPAGQNPVNNWSYVVGNSFSNDLWVQDQ